MPADDVIFLRLRMATDAELAAIARVLDVEWHGRSTGAIEDLSRELRRVAGNIVRNVGRDPHELEYEDIVEDVVVESARMAGWPVPFVNPLARRALEAYVLGALAFAAGKDGASASASEAARRAAEKQIDSDSKSPGAMKSSLQKAAMTLAIRFDKVVAAVLVLIQIRLRAEAERELQRAS
jgi:hypothetical protein